jgi:LPS O-antigen subunit length determinant protein (WzzB/FepE family)
VLITGADDVAFRQAKNNLRRSQEERDAFAKQFEQLSAAQPTDADKALRSYKQKAEDRAAGG